MKKIKNSAIKRIQVKDKTHFDTIHSKGDRAEFLEFMVESYSEVAPINIKSDYKLIDLLLEYISSYECFGWEELFKKLADADININEVSDIILKKLSDIYKSTKEDGETIIIGNFYKDSSIYSLKLKEAWEHQKRLNLTRVPPTPHAANPREKEVSLLVAELWKVYRRRDIHTKEIAKYISEDKASILFKYSLSVYIGMLPYKSSKLPEITLNENEKTILGRDRIFPLTQEEKKEIEREKTATVNRWDKIIDNFIDQRAKEEPTLTMEDTSPVKAQAEPKEAQSKGKPDASQGNNAPAKPRKNQIHKIESRKIAESLWRNDPAITIYDMIFKDEINAVFNGKSYTEQTIRNWLKDLCPNRKPGRRSSNP